MSRLFYKIRMSRQFTECVWCRVAAQAREQEKDDMKLRTWKMAGAAALSLSILAGPALSDQMLDDVSNQLATHNIE